MPACNTLVPAPRRLPAVPKVRKCERDWSIFLDFSSVAAPYRQVVGRGDFVERHACRRFASGPSDRYGFVGCTFVAFDFACSSGSAPQLGSSRMEEELVLAVVALSYMQALECAGRLRHVRRLRGFRQPNGSSTQHE